MEWKRISAWILLVGFVLLMVNILFIGYHRMISGYIYVILVAAFFFVKALNRNNDNSYFDDDNNIENENNDGDSKNDQIS